ncbi:MAG: TonB-dependent receptor plug domain-containing protein [Thalassotalea sp.]
MTTGYAEEVDNEYHQAKTEVIVITGTRTPKFLTDSPVSVTVISQDEIELLTQGTVAQTLNYIPGVVVTRNPKDGFNIQMQGFDGDNVLVLLNGQPLISPTGAAVDLDQINAQDIQQIEVIRGASSVMYGSSAMGGVINIISKQASKNQAKLSYETGSYVGNQIDGDEISHQALFNGTYITHGWANRLSMMLKSTPGFDYDADPSASPVGSLDKKFINIATTGQIQNLNVELKYQFFNEQKSKNVGIIAGQNGYETYQSDVDQYQIDLHLGKDVFDREEHEVAETSWYINTRLMNHDETSGRSGSLRNANIGLSEVNGQYVWAPSTSLEVVSGGVIHQDTLEQITLVDNKEEVPFVTKESVEAFTQANWSNDNYQILVGLRSQNDSDFGNHTAIRASGMVNLSKSNPLVQWRYGIGQGYRVPTLKERFYEFDHSALGYKVYGNENLKPEESVSLNSTINYQQSFADFDLSGEINLHYTAADNLIELFNDSKLSAAEELDISVYGNVAEAIISGADISAKINFSAWNGQISYSYLDAQDQAGNRLESRPYHQIKSNLGYSNEELALDAVLYVVYQNNEAVPIDQYDNGTRNNEWVTVDFKLSQKIFNNFTWRAGIENIFDAHKNSNSNQEQKFDARPTSSRYFYLGLTYQI